MSDAACTVPKSMIYRLRRRHRESVREEIAHTVAAWVCGAVLLYSPRSGLSAELSVPAQYPTIPKAVASPGDWRAQPSPWTVYSTVTLLARFRGLSTSQPRSTAM